MGDLSFARHFRLRPGGIECDADGLRVGGVALLARNAKDAWTRRDEGDLSRELSKLYGFPLDLGRKRRGVDAVAAALSNGELARAQIAALLLQLPDPPAAAGARLGDLEKRRLALELSAGALLKADADWDDKHPRTGRAAQPRLVRSDFRDAGGGRAEDRAAPGGERAVARRRVAGFCFLGAGGPRQLAARRRPVGDRPARAGDAGRALLRRGDPVRRDLRAERQPPR